MEDVIKARKQAIKALDRILNNNEFSNEVVKELVTDVDEIDKGLFRRLVYGVVENKIYIDYMIEKLSNIKLRKLDYNVLNILRIAIYEIRFLETKRYAAINEAVKNTKKVNFKSSGFVNGILRNFDRKYDEIIEIDLDDDKKLSVFTSTNIEIIDYLKRYYTNYEDIVMDFVNIPKLNIRVNTMKCNRDKLKSLLEDKGLIVENSNISRDSLIVSNPKEITETSEFKDGIFTIQDQASSLVSEVLNPKEGSKVLDLCAAPGSKSTHLLQIMNDKGFIVANDISENKLDKIKENFDRLNLTNYKITNFDATVNVSEFENEFDYILVDAPCSGLGVIKRKPEIKLNRTIEDIKNISEIQFEIISKAYNYLKSGGYLVYSTCTLGDIENRDIVYKLLEKYSDLKIEKVNNKDFTEIIPDNDNDGFFICKILKA